jgi:uncharacterized cupredoxin-like copper-binding protein
MRIAQFTDPQRERRIDLKGIVAAMVAIATLVPSFGMAQEHHHPGGHANAPVALHEHSIGEPGDAKRVTRTVAVSMHDTMRFVPDRVRVKRGETIRFKVTNRGKLMHEMVLGTPASLQEHAAAMRNHADMHHESANMAHVAPGATEDIVWKFSRAGEVGFGCLVPGHLEAGMAGRVSVMP